MWLYDYAAQFFDPDGTGTVNDDGKALRKLLEINKKMKKEGLLYDGEFTDNLDNVLFNDPVNSHAFVYGDGQEIYGVGYLRKRTGEKIWHEYRCLMMYIANGFFGDANAAEDAVSDAFVKILRNIDRFGEVPSPLSRGRDEYNSYELTGIISGDDAMTSALEIMR